MKNVFPQHFKDLIATTLGLQVREQEQSILLHKLWKRVYALGLPSLESYYQMLTSRQSAIVKTEWRELINLLTVNESYFLRDQGQFSLLKRHVLPEVIQRKQEVGSQSHKEIRIWSAGCSTGEEAYSLAILLKELLPGDQSWKLLILGTDLNENALDQAKQGIYSDWSFRLVDSNIQKTYFRRCRQGWEIDPSIRSMVTFQAGNLIQDGYPNVETEIHDLDLILCRNVFIYFSREAVATVLNRFYRALVPGGYLMTGHTELYGQKLDSFHVKTFRESVVYQRPLNPSLARLMDGDGLLPTTVNHCFSGAPECLSKPDRLHPNSSSSTKTLRKQLDSPQEEQVVLKMSVPSLQKHIPFKFPVLVDEVIALMDRKAYMDAIRKASELAIQDPQQFRAYYLMAEAYANLGDYLNATRICQQVLQAAPLAVEPFYLLAQIAQEQGDIEEAKKLLKRVIYLSPTSVYAYFELGCLYEQQGNTAKAQRSWQSALSMLKPMSPHANLSMHHRVTVAELQAATEQKLNRATTDHVGKAI